MITKKQLIAFETQVAGLFNKGKIRSPVHLSGGNEAQSIKIFKKVKKGDWLYTTYRSHYHAILKGMPESTLMEWIRKDKSIHLMSKKHRIVSSAIVGGTLPQALGAALAIKMRGGKEHVWAICGDMTASLGTWKDCVQFAGCNDLPITFIVEDNGLSTDTPTSEAWVHFKPDKPSDGTELNGKIIQYEYKRTWPHYGAGQFVNFDKQ